MAQEEQGWKNSLQGSFGPRQEGLRGQRHPEVEQGSAGGEEKPEPDGDDPCRRKDSSGPCLVRQGQGTLQKCLRVLALAVESMLVSISRSTFFARVAACCSLYFSGWQRVS